MFKLKLSDIQRQYHRYKTIENKNVFKLTGHKGYKKTNYKNA